jgi:hypothetical protein
VRERPTGSDTFWVLEENLPKLMRDVERLATRARRLGVAPPVLRDTGRREGGHAFVVLEGKAPTLAGWTVAAIVSHRDDAATIRIVSADAPPLDQRRFGDPRCEHCRVRRRRTQTFVLWHAATGRMRQVGSGCLRDFLGGHDVEQLCRHAQHTLLAGEALTAASRPPPALPVDPGEAPLERFAAHAAMVVRASGWVSREKARRAGREASAVAALRSLQATPGGPSAADRALASGALAWARELLAAKPELSAFERDAVAVVDRRSVVSGRDRGLVCALITVYRRQRMGSRHLGQVGEWLDLAVLVERHTDRPSERHGTVCRNDLIDVDGNRLVWWQTSGERLPIGHAIYLRGHVVRHTYFGRTAVTVLRDCRPLHRNWRL